MSKINVTDQQNNKYETTDRNILLVKPSFFHVMSSLSPPSFQEVF